MKKFLYVLLAMIVTAGLAACGDGSETEEKEVSNVESTDHGDATADAEETEAEDGSKKEFEQEIVDNDNFKATLTSVEKVVDKDWDEERFEVTFEVENKQDETIEVQAREVSADGKMIDESMLTMSQEVAGGKTADAKLVIENYDGDLPDMEDELEMKLHVFDWEYEFEEDYDVKVEFK